MRGRVAALALLLCASYVVAPAVATGSDRLSSYGYKRTVFKRGYHAPDAAPTNKAVSPRDLIYHSGRILPRSTVHALFWEPAGFSFPVDYKNVIAQYFHDVAADSGGNQNVHSVGTQYFDKNSAGRIAHRANYGVIDGGSQTVTEAFPDDCTPGSGYTHCVSDGGVRAEIDLYKTGTGLGDIYFMFLPESVDTCDSPGDCASTSFCAYHWAFKSGGARVLYANQPFASVAGCDIPFHPNGNEADDTLNVVSHEHNETITDPLGTAWFNRQGLENGDLCSFNFPNHPIPAYNQVINGDHYLLQMEWSNQSHRCRQRGH